MAEAPSEGSSEIEYAITNGVDDLCARGGADCDRADAFQYDGAAGPGPS